MEAIMARMAGRAIPLDEMMVRLGIELGAETLPRLGLRYPTAFHRCEDCAFKSACREWLTFGAPASFAPPFCANADILFELQCDQPGAHPLAGELNAARAV
jgi:Family of unknown function (DUF6455)